eukprot:COSAG01_NODE_6198_length_3798_cov_293.914572_2_plen_45_part_00
MTATGISLMHAGPNQGAFGPDIDHSARRPHCMHMLQYAPVNFTC